MLNKKDYFVDPIDTTAAIAVVIKNHYLHRTAPCSQAFGLFERGGFFGGTLKGVVCYGVPASPTLLKGLCGKDEAENVYELTRLWVDDSVPKNGESFLISNSLKKLNREIVVSFADSTQNHLGIVYQSSNWHFIGITKPMRDITVRGLEHLHSASIQDKFRGTKNRTEKLKEMYGEENVYYKNRSQKFRYIIFVTDKRRKKELLKKLLYPILPYPKSIDNLKEDLINT